MTQRNLFDDGPRFGGVTYDHDRDGERLSGALARVYTLMLDGQWRTLEEIAGVVGCTEAGASARLRDLRKPKIRDKYPNSEVEREHIERGLWRYRLVK